MFACLIIVPDDGNYIAVDLNSASNVGDDLLDGFAFTGLGCFDGCLSGLLDGRFGLPALQSRHCRGQDHTRFHSFAFVHQDQSSLRCLVILAELFPAGQSQTVAFFIHIQLYQTVDVG